MNKRGRIVLGLIVWAVLIAALTAADNQAQQREADQRPQQISPPVSADERIADYTLALAIFTLVLGISTVGLWITGSRDAKAALEIAQSTAAATKQNAASAESAVNLNRETLIANRRAFVFAKEPVEVWMPNPTSSQYHWRFRMVWRNAGDTPTRRLRIGINYAVVDHRSHQALTSIIMSGRWPKE